MKHPRLNAITAMRLMLMIASGITSAGMKCLKVKPIPTQSKATTPNCDATWLVWQDRRAVSRAVPLHSNVHCACLSIVTTAANCTSIITLPILPT